MATFAESYPELKFGYAAAAGNSPNGVYWWFTGPGGPVAIDLSLSTGVGASTDYTFARIWRGTSWDDAWQDAGFYPYSRQGETFYLPKGSYDTVEGETYLVEIFAGSTVSEVILAVTGVTYSDWQQAENFTAQFTINPNADPAKYYGKWSTAIHSASHDGELTPHDTLIANANNEWNLRGAFGHNGDNSLNLQSTIFHGAHRTDGGFFGVTSSGWSAYSQGTSIGMPLTATYGSWSYPSNLWDLEAVDVDYESDFATWLGVTYKCRVIGENVKGDNHVEWSLNASPINEPGTGRALLTVNSNDHSGVAQHTWNFEIPLGPGDADANGIVWLIAQEPVRLATPTYQQISGNSTTPSEEVEAWYATTVYSPGSTFPGDRVDSYRPQRYRYAIPIPPLFDLVSPDLSADIDRIQATFDRL